MNKAKFSLALSIMMLVGCADQQQHQQAYVSPLEFKNYNCKQIAKDMAYTSAQYNQQVGQSDTAGQLLSTALTAYMVSQRYAIMDDESNPQAEYLKAKYDALHQASIEKNCD